MPALLKHLKPHHVPATTHVPSSLTIAPAVQAIIVNCVSIVEPQLAPIIRNNAEMVMACPEDSQSACPAHSEVVFFSETGPFATCIAVVHNLIDCMCLDRNVKAIKACLKTSPVSASCIQQFQP